MFESLKRAVNSFTDSLVTRQLSESEIKFAVSAFTDRLIESDVPYELAQQIGAGLMGRLNSLKVRRMNDISVALQESFRTETQRLLDSIDGLRFRDVVAQNIREKGVSVLLFFGVNGTGKTTTVAKIANLLQQSGLSVMLVPADTFRAGAIEQLREHSRRLGTAFFEAGYGADPASIGYSAIQEARANKINTVLVDTAGRMQEDVDLMAQMKKITRVMKPDIKLFVGDGLAGNDSLSQLRKFDEAVGIDGAIITKMDADAHGGIIFSVLSIGKPVYFVGTGQGYADLEEFSAHYVASKLFP